MMPSCCAMRSTPSRWKATESSSMMPLAPASDITASRPSRAKPVGGRPGLESSLSARPTTRSASKHMARSLGLLQMAGISGALEQHELRDALPKIAAVQVDIARSTRTPVVLNGIAQGFGKSAGWAARKREVDVLAVDRTVVFRVLIKRRLIDERNDRDGAAHPSGIEQRLQPDGGFDAGDLVHMHAGRNAQARTRRFTARLEQGPCIARQRRIGEADRAAENAGFSEASAVQAGYDVHGISDFGEYAIGGVAGDGRVACNAPSVTATAARRSAPAPCPNWSCHRRPPRSTRHSSGTAASSPVPAHRAGWPASHAGPGRTP